MRTCSSWIAAWSIGLVIGLAAPVYAGWGHAKLIGPGNEGVIAVDAAGESHILYTATVKGTSNLVYTTYNTARERGKELSVPVGVYGQLAIALDSHGAPHVAVTTTDSNGLPSALSYLSLNGNVWQAQQVAGYVSTYSPLALDAQDNPHIAYFGGTSLTHAFYDGSAWQFENTGVFMDPSSIKVANDGTVYIAGTSAADSTVCEADNRNGVWNGTCFDSANLESGVWVGFGAGGAPEIAYIHNDASVNLATFDGTNWTPTVIVDGGLYGVTDLRSLGFATDSAGFGSVAFTAFGGGGGNNDLYYAHQQSDGTWAATYLGGSEEISFQPVGVGMDVDRAGAPHIVFGLETPGVDEAYLAQTLPALAVQWKSVTSATKAGKTRVTGTLQVTNFGTAAAAGFSVSYYLSADNQLDPSAALIGHSPVALGAGQTRTMQFSLARNGTLSGEYLIAEISTAHPQNEADTSTNVAAGQILLAAGQILLAAGQIL
jgi:hypothetical protein